MNRDYNADFDAIDDARIIFKIGLNLEKRKVKWLRWCGDDMNQSYHMHGRLTIIILTINK